MLILTRKIHEMVRIGDNIQIILLGISHQYARIGIQAPNNIAIYREEIYKRLKKEKKSEIDTLIEEILESNLTTEANTDK